MSRAGLIAVGIAGAVFVLVMGGLGVRSFVRDRQEAQRIEAASRRVETGIERTRLVADQWERETRLQRAGATAAEIERVRAEHEGALREFDRRQAGARR